MSKETQAETLRELERKIYFALPPLGGRASNQATRKDSEK